MATRRSGGRALSLRKVMIVDDDEDIRLVSGLALRRIGGLEVVSVASGEEALARVREEMPDLILLDVMMPRLDGPATLDRLRADPATARVPVIFLTARAQKHEVESYRRLGAVGVIVKPFDATALPDQIQRLLRAPARPAEGGADGAFDLAAFRRDFAGRLPAMLDELAAHLAALPDPERTRAARDLAHRLKGSTGSLGFEELGDALAAIEGRLEALLAAGDGDPDAARRELSSALERARASRASPGTRDCD